MGADVGRVSLTAKQLLRFIRSLFSVLGYLSSFSPPPTRSIFSLVSFSAVLFPPLPSPDGWDGCQCEMSSGGRVGGRRRETLGQSVGFFPPGWSLVFLSLSARLWDTLGSLGARGSAPPRSLPSRCAVRPCLKKTCTTNRHSEF